MQNEKKIDGKNVKVVPYGFFKLMETKRKLLSIISNASKELDVLFDAISDDDLEDLTFLVKLVGSIVEQFDETTLTWFIEVVMSQVSIDGAPMDSNDAIDIMLTGNTSLFYKIAVFVAEVNYGDFFKMLKTRLDSSAK